MLPGTLLNTNCKLSIYKLATKIAVAKRHTDIAKAAIQNSSTDGLFMVQHKIVFLVIQHYK